jgi:KaiC/GvpD/RAD55 family RecA-like ATPase
LGKFYDSLIDEIYNEILNKCEKLKQSKEIITMDKVLNMINSYEEDKIKITQNKLLKELLEDKICTDIVTKSEIVYDINDDMVFGLAGDIIELTEIDNSKNSNKNISTVNINLR